MTNTAMDPLTLRLSISSNGHNLTCICLAIFIMACGCTDASQGSKQSEMNIREVDIERNNAESDTRKHVTGEYTIDGHGDRRAYFHSTPDRSSKRKAYLYKGDRFYVSMIKGDFGYVEFTNTKGQTSTGWIDLSETVAIEEGEFRNAKKNTEPEERISHLNRSGSRNRAPEKLIKYSGSVVDEGSGLSMNYTLLIKPDFSAASIGEGPFTRIEDQGEGLYMWLDGTIIGMSFMPLENRCVVYGSDGNYFCTLYRTR